MPDNQRNTVTLISDIEAWLLSYIAMPREYALVAALWAAMTYIYDGLDVLPYLVISSLTKRSGKTLFGMDMLRRICRNAEDFSGMTGATLYRSLANLTSGREVSGYGFTGESGGTVFVDEAEQASSESAGIIRTVLNIGYKRGQTIKRVLGLRVVEFPVYAPKCFMLIGDVYDTVRDRSIILWMRRGEPEQVRQLKRALSSAIEPEAEAISARLKEAIEQQGEAIIETYRTYEGLPYLPARDEEIWLSLFAVCSVLAPERTAELGRIAADLAVEKTQRVVKYSADAQKRAEEAADIGEYSARVLVDLESVFGDSHVLSTAEALQRLREIPTAPWRRFKGDGLTAQSLASLLASRRVIPKVVRIKKGWREGEKGSTKRGYSKADIDRAIKDLT